MMNRGHGYNWGICKGMVEGNALVIRTYTETQGWKEYTKKASNEATFKQLNDAMKELAKQCRKQKVKFDITIWFQSEIRAKFICKEWSLS